MHVCSKLFSWTVFLSGALHVFASPQSDGSLEKKAELVTSKKFAKIIPSFVSETIKDIESYYKPDDEQRALPNESESVPAIKKQLMEYYVLLKGTDPYQVDPVFRSKLLVNVRKASELAKVNSTTEAWAPTLGTEMKLSPNPRFDTPSVLLSFPGQTDETIAIGVDLVYAQDLTKYGDSLPIRANAINIASSVALFETIKNMQNLKAKVKAKQYHTINFHFFYDGYPASSSLYTAIVYYKEKKGKVTFLMLNKVGYRAIERDDYVINPYISKPFFVNGSIPYGSISESRSEIKVSYFKNPDHEFKECGLVFRNGFDCTIYGGSSSLALDTSDYEGHIDLLSDQTVEGVLKAVKFIYDFISVKGVVK